MGTICSWRAKISTQTDSQRSWTRKDTNPLESQRILVKKCFSSNFQKDGWYMIFFMKTCWQDAENHSSKENTWNWHLYPLLLIKKKNMKSKKFGSIENKKGECNIWYIGRIMKMNMTNGSQKWNYLMQKRWLISGLKTMDFNFILFSFLFSFSIFRTLGLGLE